MKYILSALFFCGVFLSTQTAFCDSALNVNRDGREFPSASASTRVQIHLANKELSIIVKRRRRKIPFDLEMLKAGDFWISDDGKWIVWTLKTFAPTPSGPQEIKLPVVVVYKSDVEVHRFRLKDFENLRLEYTVSHIRWLSSVHVEFKLKTIQLTEMGDEGREFQIELATGKVSSRKKVIPIDSQTLSNENQKAYAEAMQSYAKELQTLNSWYTDENKKLADKLKDMTDTEVNANAEKLRADYNRRLIQLQSRMPQPPN